MPYFLDPSVTEAYVAHIYDLTLEQVAAARAYVLNNADTVLANHLKIEERIAAGNPPELIEQAKRTHARFVQSKEWLDNRKRAKHEANESGSNGSTEKSIAAPFPNFQDWLSSQQSSEHS